MRPMREVPEVRKVGRVGRWRWGKAPFDLENLPKSPHFRGIKVI